MMRDLMEHPNFSEKRCASLKAVIAGGAPVPPTQVKQMREKSKKINSGQGILGLSLIFWGGIK